MNSLTYLTRRCPRKCDYCSLRDSNLKGKELTKSQWVKAFGILKEMGVEFNLILGNETWLLGKDLLYIMERNEVPYALYTTAPTKLFHKHYVEFFRGAIDNLSCGLDYGIKYIDENKLVNDMEKKSSAAWTALISTRLNFPNVDCQGTVTVHKKNLHQLPLIIQDLTEIQVFCGINFIHWDKGGFDFFPSKETLKDFLFIRHDLDEVQLVLKEVYEMKDVLIQNREMLHPNSENVLNLIETTWHCQGDPYGGPTIDADGSLRCCGYRAGKFTSQHTIWELPEKWSTIKEAIYQDAMRCPGCYWSYPWMYRYWQKNDPQFGRQVFVHHAGREIDKESWSKRKLD